MGKSEPSLVPEWLRSTGGSAGVGNSSNHSTASKSDGPVLALPKRNRSLKSSSNLDGSLSPLSDQTSSSSFRRSVSSNGSAKHDKNSYSRSYSSFNRSQRDKDRERLSLSDSWDMEYSDPLRSMISGRIDDTLGRSQSMTSRKQGEIPQRRISTEMRNVSYKNNNHTHSAGNSVASVPKVPFERDFPVLGSDERPKTPDVIRVSSPGLNRGVQSLSIGNSPLIGCEGWTSALAEVPASVGSNGIGSSPALHSPPVASAVCSHSTSGAASTSLGLNMAEALLQAPARPLNNPQPSAHLQRDELAIAQSKKLIPVTPLLPKTLVNQSDKLKPKTAMRTSEIMASPKNGMPQLSPLQLGSQYVRGSSARVEGPKSPSGKMLLLKSGRENGTSTMLKDMQGQTTNINNGVVNGQSIPSVTSAASRKPSNPKLSSGEQNKNPSSPHLGHVAEKRNSQSRSDFFNLMRKKSLNSTSGATDSGPAADMVDKLDKELKELSTAEVTPVETSSKVECNGEADDFSQFRDDDAAVYPSEEEIAFLRSLGWDENSGDDEALTEEEINAFYQEVGRLRGSSKLSRGLSPKILSHFEHSTACSGAPSTEPSTSSS